MAQESREAAERIARRAEVEFHKRQLEQNRRSLEAQIDMLRFELDKAQDDWARSAPTRNSATKPRPRTARSWPENATPIRPRSARPGPAGKGRKPDSC